MVPRSITDGRHEGKTIVSLCMCISMVGLFKGSLFFNAEVCVNGNDNVALTASRGVSPQSRPPLASALRTSIAH
jgi:hypothetical protein